ncbi:MAG TPA: hypothetical protein VHI95_12640 [Acidimicrobiales bacterium]|jgi:hypothetical protein|nr:hypothetical protein [Acidimicrobiales bacterium]
MRTQTVLAHLGRIRPQAWDAIIPHGPRSRSRADWVSLNPQPLPPGPPEEAILIGAAEMAHDIVRIAVESDLRGQAASGMIQEFIDEWCGTPWPRKWPWPWPGPRSGEGPQPDPWTLNTARLVGAIIFASAGSRLGEGELSSALQAGAERLAEVAASD